MTMSEEKQPQNYADIIADMFLIREERKRYGTPTS